jgi:hypothetical protein
MTRLGVKEEVSYNPVTSEWAIVNWINALKYL